MAGANTAGAGSPASAVLLSAASEGRTVLLEHEVYALLASAGIDVPRHRLVADPAAIDSSLCAALGSEETVVKIASPDLLHKSDVGGVVLCRNEPAALREASAQVLAAARAASPQARLFGVLVVERVRFRAGTGREVLAAFRHDPAFGPVVVLGVGGLDTEALLGALRPEKARAMMAARGLTVDRALRALRGTLVDAALTGRLRTSRGAGLPDGALAGLAVSLARLAERWAGFLPPDGLGLAELEVNPMVAAEDGRLVALDGLARLHRPEALPPARPVAELKRLLAPKSAVVVGASAESLNPGRIILRNLVLGGGVPRERIWAIHPKAAEIEGCRAFPSLADLPEPADLAIVSVAADRGADQVVQEIVEKRRARTVTLIAGGFGETEGGRAAEGRIRAALAESHRAPDGGVLLNGGNCLGIISLPGRYNTFFIPPHKLPVREGPGRGLASVSQSGAYLVSQISNLDRVVELRYAISFGNQMDVTVSDYLAYLEGDPGTRVFAVYLEGFQPGDGERFLDAVRRIAASGRHVVFYKAGRTREGSAAAASHTASAVGDYEVCEELARAAGAVVASSLDQFEDDVTTFTLLEGRLAAGRRVAVLSNAGFEATAAADTLHGMELAELLAPTRERVAALLPPGIVDVHNPVDATPVTPTEKYVAIARALAEDTGVQALVVAGVPATPFLDSLGRGEGHREDVEGEQGLATLLARFFRETAKPVVFSVDSGTLYDPLVAAMRRAGLPTFRRVDRATRALARFIGLSR
ncbi:MAG TPA: acetate--CoA ligase family protein [Vicinamibacteria bacterium]|nr:acetate--CoA ligase family protein [Vicinamibacteria bacterium]